jgi:hypothetical protein
MLIKIDLDLIGISIGLDPGLRVHKRSPPADGGDRSY